MAGPDSTAAASPPNQTIVALLLTNEGNGIPAYNQWNYRDSDCNIPPPYAKDSDGDQRQIGSSGCGLCAWVSYLAAAGCVVPSYDKTSRTFTPGSKPPDQTGPPQVVDPRTFIVYLKNYIDSQAQGDAAQANTLTANIFNPDPKGALNPSSTNLITAVNHLVTLSGFDIENVFAPGPQTPAGSAVGVNIPGVTACIDANYPCVIGVHFKGSGAGAQHQVLAVGYLKTGGKTYYVINDSGFGPSNPYPVVSNQIATPNASAVMPYTPSPGTMHKGGITVEYESIVWYFPLRGLEQATGLVVTKTWTGLAGGVSSSAAPQ